MLRRKRGRRFRFPGRAAAQEPPRFAELRPAGPVHELVDAEAANAALVRRVHEGVALVVEDRAREKLELQIFANFCKFLAGSFSAVLKRNFARKYAFDSIFQALQDLHPFAPLQSQNFRKKSV